MPKKNDLDYWGESARKSLRAIAKDDSELALQILARGKWLAKHPTESDLAKPPDQRCFIDFEYRYILSYLYPIAKTKQHVIEIYIVRIF